MESYNYSNKIRIAFGWIMAPVALCLWVYFVADYSLQFPESTQDFSIFWFANGLPLAALLRTPMRRWPILLAAAFIGNVAARTTYGQSDIVIASARSFSDILQYAPCAFILRRRFGDYFDIAETKHLIWLFGTAALTTCLKIAFRIAVSAVAKPSITFPLKDVLLWGPNNFLGMFVLLFPLLAITAPRAAYVRRFDGLTVVLLAVLATVHYLVFGPPAMPASYLIIPVLMLFAWRHGIFGAGVGSLLTIIACAEATRMNIGISYSLAEAGYDVTLRVAYLELLFSAALLSCLPLAVLLEKQKAAENNLKLNLAATEDRAQRLARSENDLRTIEKRWRDALEVSGLGVWDYDRTTGKVYLSRNWKAMLGYDEDDLGDDAAAIIKAMHPDGRDGGWNRVMDPRNDFDGPFEYEERTPCKSGKCKWVRVRGMVFERTADGKPKRLIGVTADIDAAKTAKVESERRTNLYFALAACHAAIARHKTMDELARTICQVLVSHGQMELVWIGVADEETGIITPYQVYGERTDYLEGIRISTSGEEEAGRGPTGTAFRENMAVWIDDFQTDPRTKPWQDRAADYGWRGSAAVPLHRKDRPMAVLTMYTRDVDYFNHEARTLLSELAAQFSLTINALDAEDAKTQAEQRFHSVFESAPLGIAVKDMRSGRYLDVNAKFTEIVGWNREDLLAMRWQDITLAEDVAREEELMVPFFAGETSSFRIEKRYLKQDGQTRWVSMTSAPFDFGPEGGGKYLSMVEDITERKALQYQLHLAQRMDAIGQLTGGVAHDFNNLLTVVIGGGEALLEQLRAPDQREYAELILQAAQQGSELTRQLLAFAKRQPLEPHPFDVSELLGSMASLIKRTHGDDVLLSIEQGLDLHNAFADPSQTEAALLNLCLNARDAMPGGGRLTITARNATLTRAFVQKHPEAREGNYIAISVSDTGTGIAPDVIEHMFEPFFTTKDVGKGSGLGLSMVYGFIKQSEGHLDIKTELGAGTTFTMYLPAADPAAQTTGRIAHNQHELEGGTESVLIVEDNDLVRRNASYHFESLGYHVILASSGVDALAILQQREDIDLLFTDIIMPGGMNGRELAELAKRLRPRLRILYTSGYSQDALMDQGRLVDDVALLSKPFSKQQLSEKVRAVLDEVP